MKTLDYAKAGVTVGWNQCRVFRNGLEINDAIEVNVKERWAIRYQHDQGGDYAIGGDGAFKTYRDSGDFAIIMPDDWAPPVEPTACGDPQTAVPQASPAWPWYRTP